MPRGDRTGPRSSGSRTGRAAGYCAGYPIPGFMNPTSGFGRGFGRGLGRGFGRGGRDWGFCRGYSRRWWSFMPQYPYAYRPPMYPQMATQQSPEEECVALEDYKKNLEVEKTDLEQEINKVEATIKELSVKLDKGKTNRKTMHSLPSDCTGETLQE